jgi:hypothetical protein
VSAISASDGAGNTTRASWAKRATAICARANVLIRALPKAHGWATYLMDLRLTDQIATAETVELAAIPRPSGDARMIASLLGKLRTSSRVLEQEYIHPSREAPRLADDRPCAGEARTFELAVQRDRTLTRSQGLRRESAATRVTKSRRSRSAATPPETVDVLATENDDPEIHVTVLVVEQA